MLDVRDINGVQIASFDNWRDAQQNEAAAVGYSRATIMMLRFC